MSSLNLHDIYEKLTSSQLRTRHSALNELQQFLSHEDLSSRLVTEDAYGALLERLKINFRMEEAYYRKTGSSQARSMLIVSAECFRTSVEKGCLIMTRGTVKLVTSHIRESISSLADAEYKDVSPNLFASLRSVTSYPAHVEQMKRELWVAMVTLCISSVEVSNLYEFGNKNDLRSEMSFGFSHQDQPLPKPTPLAIRREIVDILYSLQSLCSFPGAPFEGNEEILLGFLFNFLVSYDGLSDSRTSAAITLSRILEHIMTNRTDIASLSSIYLLDLSSKIWNPRFPQLNEQLLINLSLAFPFIHRIASQRCSSPAIRTNVQALLIKLQQDWQNQDPKASLQVDDLSLFPLPQSSWKWKHRPFLFFHGPYFSLVPGPSSAESTWLSIQLQTCFLKVLDQVSECGSVDVSSDVQSQERKRRRIVPNSNYQDLLDDIVIARNTNVPLLLSLQRLAFYLNCFRPSQQISHIEVLHRLERFGDSNDGDVVNWSFVCMLGLLGQMEETIDTSTTALCLRIWIACSKQAALPSTCRTACAVMDAMLINNLLNVRSLTPQIRGIMEYVEQRGPALFADTSCNLWQTLFNKLEETGIAVDTWRSTSLIRWLQFRWVAHNDGDANFRAKILRTLLFPSLRLFSFTSLRTEYEIDFNYFESLPRSRVSWSLHTLSANMPLLNLLLESIITYDEPSALVPSNHPVPKLKLAFTPYLVEVLEERSLAIFNQIDHLGSNLSNEDLSWATSVAMLCMLFLEPDRSGTLLKRISALLSSSLEVGLYVDACLAAISRFLQLLDATDHPGSGVDHSIQAQLRNLLSGPSFKDFVEQLCSLYATPNHQHANILSDMDFQRHQPQTVSSSSTIDEKWAGRDISRSSTSPDSWRMRLLVRLYHEVHLNQDNFISNNSLFISRLCEPDNLLIAGREASDLVFDSHSFASHGFTATLLASFKDNIASVYAWGGNEMTAYTAMSLVSRCLVSSGHQEVPSDLYDLVLKIYRWVVKVTVYRELSSPNARIAASAMLLEISKFDINYGNEAKSEVGPGLLLIKLVEDSDVRIKFELALSIKPVFLRFPLASRIDVYREVVQNLESEEKFIERFALRAYTLMQLALASDDIRRAAMVNLLELGKFVSCKNIVCSCFALIAERLYGSKLDSLFLENSSQFIYSWIEFGYDIFEFPFDVFGFLDFETWALSVKGELISQLLNAGRWDDATDLFRNSIPFEDVLIDCLPKIISDYFLNYSVTEIHESDIAIKCAATLGSDIYRSCLTSRFAESLSIMVDRLDDKTLTEYFSSIDAPASNIFSAINLTQLSPVHPDPPQPFFSASEVLAAIEKFRESLKIPPQQIWSSANSIVVFRHLFDKAISASDTTLVISCLRRIVFVLCVAAEAMYDGYPLEMLLFGLREFLKRSDTYADALHILQHLLLAGSNYFQSHPIRLRRTILALLSALYSLNRSTSINESVQVAYDLLIYTIGETSTNGSSLHAVTALLEILRGSISYSSLSVGQIMRCLVDEEEELWSAPELCHFGLEVLRSHCNVFTEDFSTLSGIVAHFLRPEWSQSYSEDSKAWLGLAFGVSSWHGRIVEPEFRTPASYNTDHSVADSEMTCTLFVLNEIFKFMRMEPKISGLLEQSAREVSSRSRIKLPEKFGPDQRTSEYLSSRYIPNAKRPFMDLPTPSQVGFWTVIDKDFDNWCKQLACSIAQSLPNQLYSSLAYPLHSSTMFCKAIFPYLVEEYQCQRQYDGSLTKIFNAILEITWTVDSLYSKLIIDTTLLLRIRFPPTKQRHQSLLEGINYLYASNAAIRCAMHKSALMFLEMARNSSAEHSDEQVDRLLSQIYRNLDDPDLTYALSQHINRSWDQLLDVYKLHHNRDRVADIRRARLLGKVELGRNLSLEDDDFCAVADFVRQTGFPIKTEDIRGDSLNHTEEDRFVASSYSSAWRLGKWDLPPLVRSKDPDVLVYSVLYHLSRSDLFESFFPVLDKSISRLFDQISFGSNLIDSKNATLSLSILAHVSELFSGTASSLIMTSTRWRQRLVTQAKYGSYDDLEPIASLQDALFKICENQPFVRDNLSACLRDAQYILVQSFLAFCEMSRLCGDFNDLLFALAKTGFLEEKFRDSSSFKEVYPAVLTERAEVLWQRQEKAEAIQTLQSVIDPQHEESLSYAIVSQPIILAKLASWSSELRLTPSDKIVQDLFEPASRMLRENSVAHDPVIGKVSFQYAVFCTAQLEDQATIADLKRLDALYHSKRAEVDRYSAAIRDAEVRNDSKSLSRLTRDRDRAQKLVKMDKAELNRLHKHQQTFLEKAVENFLSCFTASSDYDHYVPKFTSIWLKHSNKSEVNSSVMKSLGLVPSFKFLPLLHQLCSRLSDDAGEFQILLSSLLSRILHDHPYHSVHQIFSAKHSTGDLAATKRASAAKSLLEAMSKTVKMGDISLYHLTMRLEKQFSSYSDLASLPTTAKALPSDSFSFDSFPTLREFQSKKMDPLRLPPPGMEITVQSDRDYRSVPYVQNYSRTFNIAGGVNRPKILDSILSDGRRFRELVKGNDDLHQDAIMQQVFQQMDGVLQRNRETRRRQMRIRTYQVVPLKQQTGVIEWVLDTLALSEYLERTHVAVYPEDWKWVVCRKKVSDAAQLDHRERLHAYQEVCRHFRPVLKHFFFEYFKDPDNWFGTRLSYSRSVAASSMIGHILGLGDRHGQNILLDKMTGEVVHIDLGVAFEQGKTLPVPEVVPFRLTRDVVDGLGISGYEGTFIRASTFALAVFREEEDTISTFLDVLRFDPLYHWTLSPLKKWAMQQEMQGETSRTSAKQSESLIESEADRALQLVKRKLSSRLSPEADVRRLILEATDEGNLSRMYSGWAPFA